MRSRTIGSTILSIIALAGLFACMGAGSAFAQQFQSIYGGDQDEAARGGTRPVSEGGYVSVGESFTPTGGTLSDIYVVRTNDDGTLAWSQTYNIGGNDSALDVEEVDKGDEFNGFIICGVTEKTTDPCKRDRDIFLLRLDRCGKVIWVDTYVSPKTDDIGWDVIVTKIGDASCSTSVGDFVVAGSVGVRGNPKYAYLLRVRDQAAPNIIWGNAYKLLCDISDDHFYGVTESISNKSGDLIAVGGSNGRNCGVGFGGMDAVISRVQGCDGRPISTAVYGGPHDDDLRSVDEIQLTNQGDIVATGSTEVLNDDGILNKDVYLIETKANPCDFVSDFRMGDRYDDEGYCIREVPQGHPDQGALAVTGYMSLPKGLGQKDVFLQRFQSGGWGIIAPFTRLYGAKEADWGWSVSPVLDKDPCRSAGYIIGGFTTSYTFPDQQLYLIKTDDGLKSGCNEVDAEPRFDQPNYSLDCIDIRAGSYTGENTPKIDQTCQDWVKGLCYEALNTQPCQIERCECTPQDGGLGKPGMNPANRLSFDGVSAVSSYPNPMKSGSDITLEYKLARDAQAIVTVSDINGKVIYTRTGDFQSGANTMPISTQGWAAGSYMVNIAVGDSFETKHIIVTDGK